MKPDFKRIQLCATLSALAYAGTVADFAATGFRVAHTIHSPETDTQGLVLHNAEEIIVVFRGTESVTDWFTDLKVRRVMTDWLVKDVAVHRGFLGALHAVRLDIRACVQRLRASASLRLTVTGHSLGGALAMLCALDMEDGYEPVHEVITFGQPRVGDAKFRAYYNTMLGARTVRVVNQIDAVPRMPLLLLGYRHAGMHHVFIDASGFVEMNPPLITLLVNDAFCVLRDWLHLRWITLGGFKFPVPFRVSAVVNHGMVDYIQRLEALNAR